METLNELIHQDHFEYFLEFSSKGEYLLKRAEWRELYKWLSQAIRHNKKTAKSYNRTVSVLVARMARSGKEWWSIDHYDEYRARLRRMQSDLSNYMPTHGIDATDLLKIRKQMKELSSERRRETMQRGG